MLMLEVQCHHALTVNAAADGFSRRHLHPCCEIACTSYWSLSYLSCAMTMKMCSRFCHNILLQPDWPCKAHCGSVTAPAALLLEHPFAFASP